MGIRHPLVQSGMSRVAGPELVAAVCNAGGLGILAALRLQPDALRAQIRQIRQMTSLPFGVNLWLHPAVVQPVSPDTIDPASRAAVAARVNDIRAHVGLAGADLHPARFPDLLQANFEVILDERVPVWSIGLGNPGRSMVDRCHERGVQVMAMVTNVDDARSVADAGVDVIVAQGIEAGGHRSNWRDAAGEAGTMVIVPRIADEVEQPVLAAGGIADGRGLAAALALGASGAMLGTRFISTRESIAPDFFKQAVLAAGAGDTVISSAFTGLPMRAIRNRFVAEYGDAPVLPPMLQSSAAEEIFRRAAERGEAEYFPMPAGESAGLISDLPSAAEVVASIIREARATIAGLHTALG